MTSQRIFRLVRAPVSTPPLPAGQTSRPNSRAIPVSPPSLGCQVIAGDLVAGGRIYDAEVGVAHVAEALPPIHRIVDGHLDVGFVHEPADLINATVSPMDTGRLALEGGRKVDAAKFTASGWNGLHFMASSQSRATTPG